MVLDSKETVSKFAARGRTKVVNGSILTPEMAGLRLVPVVASETGKPESPLYDLLDKKWKNAKAEFKGWYQHQVNFKLGNIQSTAVNSDVWLVHMLFVKKDGSVDDKALASCMKKLRETALAEKASVHFSTLLTEVHPELVQLAQDHLLDRGVSVYFYEEPKKPIVK